MLGAQGEECGGAWGADAILCAIAAGVLIEVLMRQIYEPALVHIQQAQLNLLRWGIPYPGIIKTPADADAYFSNKARVKRLCRQWNRWCDGDFSEEIVES